MCVLVLSSLPGTIYCVQSAESRCASAEVKGPVRMGVRHIEGNGVGYKTGYSTLEYWVAPMDPLKGAWIPFLDVRGHIFNNARLAANAGWGIRYLSTSHIWGINAYYDYRNSSYRPYQQVGAGVECLGDIWDFRLNGYLPVGKKRSSYFDTQFYRFEGHSMLLSRTYEYAFKGGNAEIGAHLMQKKNVELYAAVGPYYLNGRGGSTWGGEGRVKLSFCDYLNLEGNASYDGIFKSIFQGQLGFTFELGPKERKRAGRENICSSSAILMDRAVRPVDRNEIVALDKNTRHPVAINPATGQPYYFIFVNNTSSSAGTYESPYPNLQQAQNNSSPYDVIYVFPGNGSTYTTTYGGSSGLSMQNGQMLLGASISYSMPTTVGSVVIPALASSRPALQNATATSPVVTLSNNNTVSGFSFSSPYRGIYGSGISNVTANDNVFTSPTTNQGAIHLLNPTGQVSTSGNTFSSIAAGDGIYLLSSSGTINALTITNSSFSGILNAAASSHGNGIYLDFQGGAIANLDISGNALSNIQRTSGNGGNGIYFSLTGGSVTNATFANDTFSSMTSGGSGFLFYGTGGSVSNCAVSNNTYSTMTGGGYAVYWGVDGTNFSTLTFSDSTLSTISGSGSYGLIFEIYSGTMTNFTTSGCTFSTITTSGRGFNLGSFGGTLTAFTLDSCTFDTVTQGLGFFADLEDTHDTFTVTGNTFSNITCTSGSLGNGLELAFLGADMNNLYVMNNTFSSIQGPGSSVSGANGFFLDIEGGSSLTSAVISNNTVTGVSGQGKGFNLETDGGTLTTVTYSNNTFQNISGTSNGLYFLTSAGPSPSFTLQNSTFDTIQSNSNGAYLWWSATAGSAYTLTVTDNTFSNIASGGAVGLNYLNQSAPSGTNVLEVSNNTFSGTSSTTGWASTVEVDSDTLCLDFTGNTASPSATNSYSLVQTGGTFNRTTGSDTSTNTGQFVTSGTVGAAGSCTN